MESVYFRETFTRFLPLLRPGSILISSIKGMEPETSKRISEVVDELASNSFIYSVLSGPSFATEVVQQFPTAVVIGAENEIAGKQIQQAFSSRYFRLYYNSDVLGIEIGACVKNIIAIAAGVVDGLGYGSNTTSGLITRGLAEMNRLAVHLGAKPSTLIGLAGLGLGVNRSWPTVTQTLFATPNLGHLTSFLLVTLPITLYFALLETSPWQATWGSERIFCRALGGIVTAVPTFSLPVVNACFFMTTASVLS